MKNLTHEKERDEIDMCDQVLKTEPNKCLTLHVLASNILRICFHTLYIYFRSKILFFLYPELPNAASQGATKNNDKFFLFHLRHETFLIKNKINISYIIRVWSVTWSNKWTQDKYISISHYN